MNSPRCKHGMLATFCAPCSGIGPTRAIRRPQKRTTATVHGSQALEPSRLAHAGLVAVSAKRRHPSHSNLRPGVRAVHVLGHPFLWLVQLILDQAPDVHVIQVLPTYLRKLSTAHRALCAARGVVIEGGRYKPEGAWDDDRFNITGSYAAQKRFLDTLIGEQKALYEELLAFGFEEGEIVRCYYAPGEGVPGRTQQEIADEFGLRDNAAVSYRVQAVLRYLDPAFQTGASAQQRALTLVSRVARLRESFAEVEARQRVLARLGVASLPERMPLERVLVLEALLSAQKTGALAELRSLDERLHEIVTLRYGLAGGWRYKILSEIGAQFGVSRERIRQLEEQAFAFLGIEDVGAEEGA